MVTVFQYMCILLLKNHLKKWLAGCRMDKKPVIGITCAYTKQSLNSEGIYVHHDYHRAVIQAGGIPLILPAADQATLNAYFDLCDGFILSGGEDLDPAFFGEEHHPKLGFVYHDRDAAEFYLTQLLLEHKKPFLAICRGIQVLNVVCGGSLYQDIPSQLTTAHPHSQLTHRSNTFHPVMISENSKLYQIFQKTNLDVNSLHHQSVKALGKDLETVAVAADGIIEAVEVQNHPFGIGVQWHPESMASKDALSQRLFQSFIQSAYQNGLSADRLHIS